MSRSFDPNDTEYQKIDTLFNLGRFELARSKLIKFLALPSISQTQRIDALHLLGLTQLSLKEYTEAEAAFQQILRLDPENARAYFNLAQLKTNQHAWLRNHTKIALQYIDQAIHLSPYWADTYLQKASIYFHAGKEDLKHVRLMNSLVRKSLEIDPNNNYAQALELWTEVLLNKRKKGAEFDTRSKQILGRALQEEDTLLVLGYAYAAVQDVPSVQQMYEHVLRIATEDHEKRLNQYYAILLKSNWFAIGIYACVMVFCIGGVVSLLWPVLLLDSLFPQKEIRFLFLLVLYWILLIWTIFALPDRWNLIPIIYVSYSVSMSLVCWFTILNNKWEHFVVRLFFPKYYFIYH